MLDDQPAPDGEAQETIADFMARRRQETEGGALGAAAPPQNYGAPLDGDQTVDPSSPFGFMNSSARFGGVGLLGPVDQLPQVQVGGDAGLPPSLHPDSSDGGGLGFDLSPPTDSADYMARILGNGLLGPVDPVSQDQLAAGVVSQPQTQSQSTPPDGSTSQDQGGDAGSPAQPAQPDLHPGFAESLIPVWGPAREAYADYKDGNYVGAGLNAALAGSDLFLAGDIAKAFAKGGWYALRGPLFRKPWEQKWTEVRRQMGEAGMMKSRQEGHHWFIPQKNTWVPDFIKNHPINIKAMPEQAMHRRITGKWQGAPKFNQLESYWYGTPTWSKVASVDALGHPVAAATANDPDQ